MADDAIKNQAATTLLEPGTPEGDSLLGERQLTAEPCRRHPKKMGSTRLLFSLQDDQPVAMFARNRVLFYHCMDCSEETWERTMPDCPAGHRPYRYAKGGGILGCHACNHEAAITATAN